MKMKTSVVALLAVCGLVLLGVVAAVAFVATRGQEAAPLAEFAAAAAPPSAVEEPDAESLKPRDPPRPLAPVAQAEASVEAEDAAADAPEEDAETVKDKAVAEAMARLSKRLGLRPEQVEAASKEMEELVAVLQEVVDIQAEFRDEIRGIRDMAREENLPREQVMALVMEKVRGMIVDRQGEMLNLMDRATAAGNGLRPHLDAEQMPKLDKMLLDLDSGRTRLLQGTLDGRM